MSSRLLLLAAMLGALAAGLVPGCYGRQEDDQPPPAEAKCTGCHGDPSRSGDHVARAAPPRDLEGNTAVGHPGVGAHQNHLQDSETHLAIACAECHGEPPTDTRHSNGKVDLPFGSLAKTGGRAPSFDPATFRCSDTYCHRTAVAYWTQPRSSEDACGSCHGIPPASHPAVTREQCVRCHPTMDSSGNIADRSKHVNGTVETTGAGCTACHGSESDGIAAPPLDLAGNTDSTAIGVGAHRWHLEGKGKVGRAVGCEECHQVPADVSSPGHADSPLPAEVTITGVATTNGRSPAWSHDQQVCSNTWCHGPDVAKDTPAWTSGPSGLGCTSCHGQPPPWPHVQMTDCSRCHGDVVEADNVTIKDKTKHVNGIINVAPKTGCTDCHGSSANPNFAPPVDIAGNTDTKSPGVGAHQSHLVGTKAPGNPGAWHRAIQCSDCHLVPASWTDAGHIDTFLPAELTFGPLAQTNSASPTYANGKCDGVYCHGAKLKGGMPGGANTSPEWTKVDGTQAACGGTCHGLPPGPPHPQPPVAGACKDCHGDVIGDSITFVSPEKHIDGKSIFDP